MQMGLSSEFLPLDISACFTHDEKTSQPRETTACADPPLQLDESPTKRRKTESPATAKAATTSAAGAQCMHKMFVATILYWKQRVRIKFNVKKDVHACLAHLFWANIFLFNASIFLPIQRITRSPAFTQSLRSGKEWNAFTSTTTSTTYRCADCQRQHRKLRRNPWQMQPLATRQM